MHKMNVSVPAKDSGGNFLAENAKLYIEKSSVHDMQLIGVNLRKL